MTNQLSTALEKAGFPPLQTNKRIWLWLHDHPGKTTAEIAAALSVAKSTVSVALHTMTERKMITRCEVRRRNHVGPKKIFEYSTCIREYELLPLPKGYFSGGGKASDLKALGSGNGKVATKTAEQCSDPSAPGIKLIDPSVVENHPAPTRPVATAPAAIDVDKLPLGEAHQLWIKLSGFFGGVPA